MLGMLTFSSFNVTWIWEYQQYLVIQCMPVHYVWDVLSFLFANPEIHVLHTLSFTDQLISITDATNIWCLTYAKWCNWLITIKHIPWMFDWLTGCRAGRMGWLASWLAGWLAGWLACCQAGCLLAWPNWLCYFLFYITNVHVLPSIPDVWQSSVVLIHWGFQT